MGCRDRTREATRGNANRGETYPPAVHADARHYTEPVATASSTRHSLSRFALSSLARRLKIPPGRSDVMSPALTVVGQKAGTGLWTLV